MQLPTLIENSSNDGTDNDLMVPRISVLKCKISVEEGKIDLIQKWPFMQLSSRPEFNIHKNKMAQYITNKMILKSTNDLIREEWRQLVCKKSPHPILPILLCIIGLSVCKVCRRGIFSWKTQEKCSILSKLFCLKSFCAQYIIILIRPNIICKSENSRFQNHNFVRICTLPPQWGCKYGWTGGKTWFVYAKQPTMRLIGLERG